MASIDQPRDNLGRFLSKEKDRSHLNFNSTFADRLGRFLNDAPGQGISIYSGYRSPQRQRELFNAAVAKYGSAAKARSWVAPPGKSRHNMGFAADLRYATPEARAWAHANAKNYNLGFRMGHEPWHIEPTDVRNLMALGQVGRPQVDVGALPEAMSAPMAFATANDIAARNQAAEALSQQFGAPNIGFGATGVAPAYSAPFGEVQRSPLGNLPPTAERFGPAQISMPSMSVPATGPVASAYAPAQGLPGQEPTDDRFAPSVAAPVSPLGPMAAAQAPAPPSSLASAYGQMAQGLTAAGVDLAGNALNSPQGIATASTAAQTQVPQGLGMMALTPKEVPQAPPAAPPAALPPLAPPKALREYPVYQPPAAQEAYPSAPMAPPSFTPTDIYGGAIGSAQASGGNTVSRDENGITSVTNKYGVTTGMTPTGKQTAYGPGFGPVGGLFGGMNGMSSKTKGMLAGAALGALAGGLPGALAGGLLGRAVTGGRNSFPGAPSKQGESQGVPGGARTASERSSISPAASRSMSANGGRQTGLW